MLERLLIQNFQAHDKLRIDFDPCITTIVGPSDVGKSAVIRALRWVCNNTPGGDAFVRHGAPGATVRLLVDGHTITRRRNPGGDINEYHLDEAEYKAFGRAVPEPIEDLLNMGPTCWQQQHDAPYWFAESAGEVSRQLNTIVNLGIIDTTLANVAKAVHRARTKLEIAESALTEAKTEYDALAWVPGFEAAVGELETVEIAYQNATRRAAQAAQLAEAAQTHETTHEKAAQAATAAQNAVDAGAQALQLGRDAALVAKLVEEAIGLRDITFERLPSTKALDAAYNDTKTASSAAMALQTLIDDIRKKETALCQAEKNLTQAIGLVPKSCPTCGQSL